MTSLNNTNRQSKPQEVIGRKNAKKKMCAHIRRCFQQAVILCVMVKYPCFHPKSSLFCKALPVPILQTIFGLISLLFKFTDMISFSLNTYDYSFLQFQRLHFASYNAFIISFSHSTLPSLEQGKWFLTTPRGHSEKKSLAESGVYASVPSSTWEAESAVGLANATKGR